jgi:hypothetical protein
MVMKLTRAGGTAEGERVTFTPFDPKDLGTYPGTYWSEELETQYTVTRATARSRLLRLPGTSFKPPPGPCRQ